MTQGLQINYYWSRVEFTPGRGQIHLHLLGIGRNRSYLYSFYKASTKEEQATIPNDYAENILNMTADIEIDNNHKIDISSDSKTPLRKRFYQCDDENEDFRLLAQEVLCHKCNEYCLNKNKSTTVRKKRLCRCGFGCETHPGKCDTPGKPFRTVAALIIDHRKIEHLQMKRLHSQRVNQTSKTLLQSWRANCDIQLIFYHSNPKIPDMEEIQKVSKYVTSYTVKRHFSTKQERNDIQDIVLR